MEKEDIVKFYTKMNKIRAGVLAADWEKDKYLSFGAKGYHYLSVDKMKRNIAPILLANGMELSVHFHDLEQRQEIGSMSQHWTVMLDATLVDMETGFEKTYMVYGESGDSGDKGVSKAQTAAMKQFLSNTFMLIDGIEPDAEDAGMGISGGGTFVKDHKTNTDLRNAIISKALKEESTKQEVTPPTPKAPKPATPTPKAPKPDAPAPVPTETKVDKVVPIDDEKGLDDPMVIPDDALGEMDVSSLSISKPQASSIENIVRVRYQWVKEKKSSPLEFNTMREDFKTIKDTQTAMAFIKKYRVIGNV